jgi:hypothetical protein
LSIFITPLKIPRTEKLSIIFSTKFIVDKVKGLRLYVLKFINDLLDKILLINLIDQRILILYAWGLKIVHLFLYTDEWLDIVLAKIGLLIGKYIALKAFACFIIINCTVEANFDNKNYLYNFKHYK